ncbi:selenocysteine-specific elongation factor-like isoform X2 [Antedon mediterranea]
MMLVIDVTKGMQTQSAECLIIGEITCKKMVVVLNKVDLLPAQKKQATIDKMTKRMLKTLECTCFPGSPVIAVAAKPGGPDGGEECSEGIDQLIEELKHQTYIPARDSSGPLLFSLDHCFAIRGQGTVMTGTMLSGKVTVNDTVEIPALKVNKKVKSMQMFHKPVTSISQGDRAGICVTQFDPKQLERGLVCTPGTLPTICAGIISVKKISYFKGACTTKAKFHVTMGHDTVMSKVTFFRCLTDQEDSNPEFSFSKEFIYQAELLKPLCNKETEKSGDFDQPQTANHQWALLEFEKPVTCPEACLVIGSKLDTDIHSNTCRLAFHGRLVNHMTEKNYLDTVLPQLKIFKTKCREGFVERMTDEYSVIGRSLFKKETNIQLFVGLKVNLSTGEEGVIEGGFGQSGKFKVRIPSGLGDEASKQLSILSKKKGKKKQDSEEVSSLPDDHQPIKIILHFKRYIFDAKKQMIQS